MHALSQVRHNYNFKSVSSENHEHVRTFIHNMQEAIIIIDEYYQCSTKALFSNLFHIKSITL